MSIILGTPSVADLPRLLSELRSWQREGAPMHLHPGDVGWYCRFGPQETAAALRCWYRDERPVAVGLLDGPGLLRMTTDPNMRKDEELAAQLAHDIGSPSRGVLPQGRVLVEAPADALVHQVLADAGWPLDEPWTPLRRDLTEPVAVPDVPVRVIDLAGPDGQVRVEERVAVQRAAFARSTFTAARWHAMASGAAYTQARCLIAYADGVQPAAAVTVWSAGRGRPGLLEPMGVDPAHRGHGFGRTITLAAAEALRQMGASSAVVCTPSANVPGVRTYEAAGFVPDAEVHDRYRP
ncbi:MAG TPA: GNAT family N-acetyltransferase [Beutenbergiaceae bacterium]|nr:GNAT family N-acetyltransferase [Beutenbergiaceae bacterium]